MFETISQCTYDAWRLVLLWLMSHGENVTSFQMKFQHSHYKEEDFTIFFSKMKKLKSFYLYHCDYLDWTGTCLLDLPFESIQEIILTSYGWMMPFDNDLLSLVSLRFRKKNISVALRASSSCSPIKVLPQA